MTFFIRQTQSSTGPFARGVVDIVVQDANEVWSGQPSAQNVSDAAVSRRKQVMSESQMRTVPALAMALASAAKSRRLMPKTSQMRRNASEITDVPVSSIRPSRWPVMTGIKLDQERSRQMQVTRAEARRVRGVALRI